MLDTLDASEKKQLKRALLHRHHRHVGLQYVTADIVKKSKVLQTMIEEAARQAMEKKELVLESVDDYINEHYEGKVDDFVKDRPAALMSIEIRNVNTLASEIFKKAKDAYTEMLKGWPLAISALAFRDRNALKGKYEALALVLDSSAKHIHDDIKLLKNIQDRKTIEVATDVGGTQLLATLESLANTSVEIIKELHECSAKIAEAAEEIQTGRRFFLGKKKDQAKIPIEAVQAAIHVHHSAIRVNSALDAMAFAGPGKTQNMKAGLPVYSSQLYKFLTAVARVAGLTTLKPVEALETQLMRGDVKETGIWWLVQLSPMDLPTIDKKEIEKVKKINKKATKTWNSAPPVPKEIQAVRDKLLEDLTGPI